MMKIQKWGNSLGIRIPMSFAEQLKISDGSEVEMFINGEDLIIQPKKVTLDELLDKVTSENKHQEIDFGTSEGREIW
ncbi:AbrB/MazE/SpoVT family DNA-binding domain-containing protein [Paenibacillus marinisediminis]